MKWLLPVAWAFQFDCFFWPQKAKEGYHLMNDTLSPRIIMGEAL
jgi:hypothetical protein